MMFILVHILVYMCTKYYNNQRILNISSHHRCVFDYMLSLKDIKEHNITVYKKTREEATTNNIVHLLIVYIPSSHAIRIKFY